MLEIVETTRFRRDVKRAKKRGLNMQQLVDVVAFLAEEHPLPEKHYPHPLAGVWKSKWECHIAPDWLLIYQIMGQELHLIRTGTHSDLFRM